MNFFPQGKKTFFLKLLRDEVLVIKGPVERERSERTSALWEKGKVYNLCKD